VDLSYCFFVVYLEEDKGGRQGIAGPEVDRQKGGGGVLKIMRFLKKISKIFHRSLIRVICRTAG